MITPERRAELIARAREARRRAYAPYSHFAVGAALLGKSGKTYEGVNVENASYPLTVCAERTAVFKAVSEGEREFEALAIVNASGGSPCGACRQVLSEFGLDILVIAADTHGNYVEKTVAEWLPGAFGSNDLVVTDES